MLLKKIEEVNQSELTPIKLQQSLVKMETDTTNPIFSDSEDESLGTIDAPDKNKQNLQTIEAKGRAIVCTPSRFGLTTYNPDLISIEVHKIRVDKACAEAKAIGASDQQCIRLFMRSLGTDFEYAEALVPQSMKDNYSSFTNEVVKILGDKRRSLLHHFLQESRKPGEQLLPYYGRLLNLYSSAHGFVDDNWKTESAHCSAIYVKLLNAMYPDQRTEITRQTEELFEKNELKLPALQKILIDVSKNCRNKISSETLQTIQAIEEGGRKNENYRPAGMRDNRWNRQNNETRPKNILRNVVCYNFNKPGHMRAQCWSRGGAVARFGNKRETKTRGRQPWKNNAEARNTDNWRNKNWRIKNWQNNQDKADESETEAEK